MMNICGHWQHNIYLWFRMSERKMSDMIDTHSGFFQTLTSIHTMAADLTVSDKHIFLLPHMFSIKYVCCIFPSFMNILPRCHSWCHSVKVKCNLMQAIKSNACKGSFQKLPPKCAFFFDGQTFINQSHRLVWKAAKKAAKYF